jgi:hypothetical protein
MRRNAAAQRAAKAVAIAALTLLCAASRAATSSIDYTDTWWNPAEDGWGLQVVQQVDVMFATLYVYDAHTSPDWYTAALTPNAGAWKGELYATQGPWFGGQFNPAAVSKRHVGDFSITFTAPDKGTLAYSVDGVPVTRQIQRYTMRNADMSGTYLMWMNATMPACAGSPGQAGALAGLAQFTHSGSALSAQIEIMGSDGSVTCSYSGNLVQTGRVARADGTFSCPSGGYGTFSLSDLEVATDHMCGDFAIHNAANGCSITSTFASVRN